ncbi:PREDICTED: sodium-coupled monocarboxylate transporter 2-like [Nicrophorus vespilloides]|uniref:Sodium-coupled monocarboxylate transporter 2-like n=1 Tax=Nicrophorus vespilloides TaxID=110193 RepID=A0ABM1NDA1_NICVS|nr:PREDICTED: sodium-coupled monocarboxylate transporter 2-like [Nicrophorus vespilloides]
MIKFTADKSRLLCLTLILLIHNPVLGALNDSNVVSTEDSIDQCVDGHSVIKNSFSWADYVVLAGMLVISCGIGVFYGFFGDKQTTSSDFLLGGSSMGTFPMAMSLAASFITAIELLGNPAEMYFHGSQYWMICLAFILVVPLTSKFYLPVYMKLRLTSTFEYLQLRFSPNTRYLASGLYILQMVLYTSVAVYAPALALSRVTGLNVYLAVSVVYVVCIFYASQGGMKAVIMTDTFQAGVLLGSILLIVYFGEKFVGGAGVIWSQNYNTERLELFDMNPNPTIRHSFWSVVLGGTFYWMTMFCSNQASIQKYMSVERISQVRKALWFSCFGLILIYTINFYTGMIMVAHYRNCDPLLAGDIEASDQILPLYVISEMGHLKGMTGFFVAGIFAASLGTVASALNSLAAVTCQDFVTGAFGINMPDSKGALWAKWISIGYGALSFALVFVVEQLGSVMQVAISFNGMVGGVTLGLFSLGMFFPWANSKGAIVGSIVSMALIVWMGLGQQIAIASGNLSEDSKPSSTEQCPCLNATIIPEALVQSHESEVFFLYRISFLWYSAIGFMVTLIVGVITSVLTGCTDPQEVDADLISPPIQDFLASLPKCIRNKLNLPPKQSKQSKDIGLKGVLNASLDISDEAEKPNGVIPV